MGNGEFDPHDMAILQGIADWWQVNGESIRGTDAHAVAGANVGRIHAQWKQSLFARFQLADEWAIGCQWIENDKYKNSHAC